MAETAGEKTQAPTPKRKQKALDDGDLLKSREFGAALIMLLGLYLDSNLFFEAALLIAVMGFVSTVAIAKHLLRGNIIE